MSVSAGVQVLRVSSAGPFLSFSFLFFLIFSYISWDFLEQITPLVCAQTLWGVAVNIALHYTSERNRTAKRKTVHFSVVKVRKQAKGAAQLFVLHGGDEHPHSCKGRGRIAAMLSFPPLVSLIYGMALSCRCPLSLPPLCCAPCISKY